MPFIQKTIYSDWLIDYLNYGAELRGILINSVAEMEEEMDNYIAKHFCYNSKRRTELREIIISTKHLTFQAKADIYKSLLVRRKDLTIKEANQLYDKMVNKIAADRNIIAHAILDTSHTALNRFHADKRTVTFIKFSNGKHPTVYDNERMLALLDLIHSVKSLPLLIKSEKHIKKLVKNGRRTSRKASVKKPN